MILDIKKEGASPLFLYPIPLIPLSFEVGRVEFMLNPIFYCTPFQNTSPDNIFPRMKGNVAYTPHII